MIKNTKIIVTSVMFKPRPIVKLKNPRFTSTAENPTFSALKKKFFTGPLGNIPLNRDESAEPMMPPMIVPAIM